MTAQGEGMVFLERVSPGCSLRLSSWLKYFGGPGAEPPARPQNGTSPALSAAVTNFATTFFSPALSKAISSLSPSMPVISP